MTGSITHDSPVYLKDGFALVDGANIHKFHIELEGTDHTHDTTPDSLEGAIIFETFDIENVKFFLN